MLLRSSTGLGREWYSAGGIGWQVCGILVEHGCDLKLKDLSDRRASELLPASSAGAWLVERTKQAVRQHKLKLKQPHSAD